MCIRDRKNIDLFDHHHIFSPKETAARYGIQLENYINVLQIEASTMLELEMCIRDRVWTMYEKRLIELALKARENAYCPYSGFAVGAALLVKQISAAEESVVLSSIAEILKNLSDCVVTNVESNDKKEL